MQDEFGPSGCTPAGFFRTNPFPATASGAAVPAGPGWPSWENPSWVNSVCLCNRSYFFRVWRWLNQARVFSISLAILSRSSSTEPNFISSRNLWRKVTSICRPYKSTCRSNRCTSRFALMLSFTVGLTPTLATPGALSRPPPLTSTVYTPDNGERNRRNSRFAVGVPIVGPIGGHRSPGPKYCRVDPTNPQRCQNLHFPAPAVCACCSPAHPYRESGVDPVA